MRLVTKAEAVKETGLHWVYFAPSSTTKRYKKAIVGNKVDMDKLQEIQNKYKELEIIRNFVMYLKHEKGILFKHIALVAGRAIPTIANLKFGLEPAERIKNFYYKQYEEFKKEYGY